MVNTDSPSPHDASTRRLSISSTASSRDVEQELKKIEKDEENLSVPLEISGLHRLFLRSGGKKRDKLSTLMANSPLKIEFSDGFPLTQQDLKLRLRINSFFSLPITTDVERNTRILLKDEDGVLDEGLRSDMKRKQGTAYDFNDPWREVKAEIVRLKAFRLTEKEIVAKLKADNIKTVTGKPIPQSTINRLYHDFMETAGNLLPPGHGSPLGVALNKSDNSNAITIHQPIIDRSHFSEINQEPSSAVAFENIITIHFKDGSLGADGCYADILNRDGKLVETLFFPSMVIENNTIRLNVLEDTVLTPGFYVAKFYNDLSNRNAIGTPNLFRFKVGQKSVDVKGVKLIKGLDGKLMPVPN